MGVQYNSRIVTDGLVLALDAGNNKSHSSNRFISYGSGLVTEGVGFAVNGDGIFQRIAAGTVIGGYTVKTTDVVYSYALGSNGCHYHGNSTPIPAGVYATFTCDYLVTNATNYPVNGTLLVFENYGGGALQPSGVGVPNNLQNVWQRVTLTAGPTSSAGTQAMFLYPGYCGGRMADSGTLYMRNPRVEWTNVDTGTENFSSRPNTNIWYDMSGNGNNGTLTNTPYHFIGVDGTNGYMSFDGSNDFVLLSSNTTFGNNTTWEAWIYSTGNVSTYNMFMGRYLPYFGFYAGNGLIFSNRIGGNQVTIYASGLSLNTWYHTTFTTSYDGTNTTMRIYVNGVETSSAVYGGAQGNYSNPFMIGDGNNSSNSTWYPFVGRISNVKIYNRTLTVNEIQQNFQALRGRFGI
jgi:hypothetical protein